MQLREEVMASADHESVLVCEDPQSGLTAIIAIHSTRRGPGFGGIRRRHYATRAQAMGEVLALAEAMSLKCAVAELPAGGAKAVVLDHDALDRQAAYAVLGRAVAELGGSYVCGPDIGTGDAELAAVRRHTDHVNPPQNDPAAATAAGVLAGLRGILEVLDSSEADMHAVIQGLGAVGLSVARELITRGARVCGADVRREATRAASELGVTIIPPSQVLETECDVLMPCALGNVIDREVAAVLPCRAVCGSANNQLADADAAAVLHARRILHAPDIVVSAGAVIEGVLTVREGDGHGVRDRVAERIGAIGTRTAAILRASVRTGTTPDAIARERGLERLARG